jgi:hypothetical protein
VSVVVASALVAPELELDMWTSRSWRHRCVTAVTGDTREIPAPLRRETPFVARKPGDAALYDGEPRRGGGTTTIGQVMTKPENLRSSLATEHPGVIRLGLARPPRKASCMSLFDRRAAGSASLLTISALALASAALIAPSADAAGDRDGDGMPNRWETRHGLDPDRADGSADQDDDGLTNLAEFRHHGDPGDEDTDNDGDDDGDEVHDGARSTQLDDRDTDDDGVRDGDEDADHDGVDNEDEDDATERCARDDDDRDGDHLADEDENDFGDRVGSADSDDDGIPDGDEDADEDGQSNEDDDDSADDRCGRSGEDDDDLLGSIVSFDAETGDLVVATVRSGQITFVVTDDTEIEYDGSGHGSGGDASVDDLTPGAVVNEVDLEDDGTLEEIELARPAE